MKGISKAAIISGCSGCVWNFIAIGLYTWLMDAEVLDLELMLKMLIPSFFIGWFVNYIAEVIYGKEKRGMLFSIFTVYLGCFCYWGICGNHWITVFYAFYFLTILPYLWGLFILSYLNHWIIFKLYNKSRVVTP